MKNFILIILGVFISGLLLYYGFKSKPVTKSYYYLGQIIYPNDYNEDTLVVINPLGLNEELNDCLLTGEKDYVLHKHCVIANTCIGDYQLNVNMDGYTIYDSYDTVTGRWGNNGHFEMMIDSLNQ